MKYKPFHRQKGVVLVIGLLYLAVLTALSAVAAQSVLLQERMAGNARDRNLALQAAEAALRDAEHYIRSDAAPFAPLQPDSFDGSGGLYDARDHPGEFSRYDALTDPAATRVLGADTGAVALPRVSAQPRYLIELLAVSCTGSEDQSLYRITSRAQGVNEDTVVVLQSRYRRDQSCAGGASGVPSGGDGDAAL